MSGIRKQKGNHSSELHTKNHFATTYAHSDSFLELKGLVTKMTLELRNEINSIKSQMQMHVSQNIVPVPKTYLTYQKHAQAAPNYFANYFTTRMMYSKTHH